MNGYKYIFETFLILALLFGSIFLVKPDPIEYDALGTPIEDPNRKLPIHRFFDKVIERYFRMDNKTDDKDGSSKSKTASQNISANPEKKDISKTDKSNAGGSNGGNINGGNNSNASNASSKETPKYARKNSNVEENAAYRNDKTYDVVNAYGQQFVITEKGPVEMDKFIESGGEYLGEERGFEMYNILHKKKLRELQEERARKEGKSEAVENDKQEKPANDKYLVQP
ncbi:MAG: hypothetical protein LBG46_06700, partial [Elusimicrobiota bacterium]|nr:hypothetical protein [Elusimicrobiota bacterium]